MTTHRLRYATLPELRLAETRRPPRYWLWALAGLVAGWVLARCLGGEVIGWLV